MYGHLTNAQVIIGGFALVLIFIFALAAFLDKYWRTTEPSRKFGSDGKPCSFAQRFVRHSNDESSALYSRYADLCTCGLGTSTQQICFRGEKQQNLARD